VTAGRTQTLSENDVRDWRAVVHQVPRCLVVLSSVHQHTQLVLHSVRNVKPMEHKISQTVIVFLCVRLRSTLVAVCLLQSSAPRRRLHCSNGMTRKHGRVRVKLPSNTTKLSKPEKSRSQRLHFDTIGPMSRSLSIASHFQMASPDSTAILSLFFLSTYCEYLE